MKRIGFLLCITLLQVVSGCGGGSNADAPPKIAYGRDECAECGMIINDERYAAALRVIVGGRAQDLLFDDIGDMLDYEREHAGQVDVTRRYVHDFEERVWTSASDARFLRNERYHTPMGSGIIAFAAEPAAEKRQASDGGRVKRIEATAADSAAAAGASAAASNEGVHD